MPYARELNVTTQYKSGFDRVRVDAAQTGFFEGRMFRAYDKVTIPVATERCYRFTSPVNFELWLHKLTLLSGGLSISVFDSTAVPGGSWTQLPIIGVNRMAGPKDRRTPLYNPQITVEKGGSFTGGNELDYFELLSTATSSAQATNVATDAGSERGLPATTFYLRAAPLSGVNSDSIGVHYLLWEERPASVTGWNPNDGVI